MVTLRRVGFHVVFAVLLSCPLGARPERANASPAPAPRPPAPAGLSWEQADGLAAKLDRVHDSKERRRRPASVHLTEAELNSYLNLYLAEDLPAGVSHLMLRLENGERFRVQGIVDLDTLGTKLAGANLGPLAFLGGSVPVALKARLQSQDGFGTVEVEELLVATVPLPVSVLEQMVAQATRSQSRPAGVDLRSPFRLPHALKRLKTGDGELWLEF